MFKNQLALDKIFQIQYMTVRGKRNILAGGINQLIIVLLFLQQHKKSQHYGKNKQ